MATMKLYNADLSPFTSRVRIQIRAKGLESQIAISQRPEGDAYKAINPTGRVPSLDTGLGFVLPESETIAEYIEDNFPEPSLRGLTALSKAKVRLMSRIVDLYLMGGLQILFGQIQARDAAKIEEGLAKLSEGLGYVERYLEGPRYAIDNRLTLADCALAPALFFTNVIPSLFSKPPFLGFDKAKAYFEKLSEDTYVAPVLGEMGAALRARQAAAA
jgi:glutathione S-transferase